MRKYQSSFEDTTGPKVSAASSATDTGPRVPTMYRTWVAIGSVALTLAMVIVIASGSGKGRPEGGKFPRVVVVSADGLQPAALRAAMASNKAPNLQALTSMGTFATCGGGDDLCATSEGLDALLNGRVVGSALSVNDTTGPTSFLQKARQLALRPAVIAPESMFSGTNFIAEQSRCERVGVLDRECMQDGCWDGKSESCNRALRYAYTGDGTKGVFESFAKASAEYSELIFMHLNTNRIAGEASDFTDQSLRYLSSVYLVDSLIGRMVMLLRERSASNFENWLLVITAPQGAADSAVPFFVAGFSNTLPVQQVALKTPVRTVDVYPTVMKWLGIADSAVVTDGVVQGVCSSGVIPAKCAAPPMP